MTSMGRESSSPWSPLSRPVFRALWIANLASLTGTWIHEVGVAWLMTSLTKSPFTVSLIQTAAMLPFFFVALPAGALADIIDRRRLLIATQIWMLMSALVLGVAALMGMASPVLLLVLTFSLSLGAAINGPAWQAVVPELVTRDELPAAVTLGSVGYNMARAVGPAIGGCIVSLLGPGVTFLVNAASFLGVVVVLGKWRGNPQAGSLPTERLIGAMRTGLRYVRNAPKVRTVLVHTAVFSVFTSALWAFLPIIARQYLKIGSTGYGLLLGFFGGGAIVGAFLLPRFRSKWSLTVMVSVTTALFAVVMACLGTVRDFRLMVVVMTLGGMAWLVLISTLSIAVQSVIPSWVRGRVLSVFMLVFAGGFAGGSTLWGTVALWIGIPWTLVGAAMLLAGGILVTQRYELPTGEGMDLSPAGQFPSFSLHEDLTDEGRPVLITIDRRIDRQQADEFLRALRPLKMIRLRDGAMRWNVFRDVTDPSHYIESFIVESWTGYFRQHERLTISDREIENRVDAFHVGAEPPATLHFFAELVPKEKQQ